MRHWDGLADALAADRAVLGPAAARLLVWALDVVDAKARRDGVRLGNAPAIAHIREVLEYVADAEGDMYFPRARDMGTSHAWAPCQRPVS